MIEVGIRGATAGSGTAIAGAFGKLTLYVPDDQEWPTVYIGPQGFDPLTEGFPIPKGKSITLEITEPTDVYCKVPDVNSSQVHYVLTR